MILKVIVNNQLIELNVPEEFVAQAADFFTKMDADMDAGWQVERDWVDAPDPVLRAQIASDKLLSALENEDHKLGRMMAGYIVSRFPDIETLELKRDGDTADHKIIMQDGSTAASTPSLSFSSAGLPAGLTPSEAATQAGKDVSKVFRMGKQYRFTVYNHQSGEWDESPTMGNQEEAETLREQAFQQRLSDLTDNA